MYKGHILLLNSLFTNPPTTDSITIMNGIKKHTLTLQDFMKPDTNRGWGSEHGIQVQKKLIAAIHKQASADIIYLSMKGIEIVDASFSREAIIKPACEFRCKKGICIVDVENEDYIDNFIAAAIKLSQPIILKLVDRYEIFGPYYPETVSKGNKPALDHIWKYDSITATELSEKLDLKLTNASTKLKQLVEQGFILRRQDTASSGGVEYIYHSIK